MEVICYQPRAAIARGKNIVVEVSMAKYWTTEMTMRVANGCLDLREEGGA
jgi:alkylation response protein AidB-like acyl-CoA dehydrogenase